jgi:hypothetical protein
MPWRRMREWSASRPCRFTPGERAPGTHWIGDWVGPRAGLDLQRLEFRPLGRPACSQSLSRFHIPFNVGLESQRTASRVRRSCQIYLLTMRLFLVDISTTHRFFILFGLQNFYLSGLFEQRSLKITDRPRASPWALRSQSFLLGGYTRWGFELLTCGQQGTDRN